MPVLLYPENDAAWHKMRHADVTSTEAAALFGLSPYCTAFELAVQKKEAGPPSWEDSERMFWGRMHERTIARVIGLRYGVKIRKLSAYARHNTAKMGSSFDYEIVGVDTDRAVTDTSLQELYLQHGPGVLECKNVDAFVYSRQWKAEGDDEVPGHIEIQVQHQLEVIDREWTVVAALVGGNKLERMIRLRDREVGLAIREKAVKFWLDLGADIMPPIDLPADYDIIRKVYGYSEPGKLLDARGDTEITALCAQYKAAASIEKSAGDEKKSAMARLLMAIGEAERVVTNGYNITASMIAPAEVSYTRDGYRKLTITKQTEKKGAKK